VDEELAGTGVRGQLDADSKRRRVRSTRRRQDTPDLPRRPAAKTTVGRTYTDERTGKTFRPSLFVTLTLPSYGPVRRDDHLPVDPTRYDYVRAARDALHFGKLLDRWCQNLRRVAGYDVQYFAVVERQKRAAPHAHFRDPRNRLARGGEAAHRCHLHPGVVARRRHPRLHRHHAPGVGRR
jgi:hypothetical protein